MKIGLVMNGKALPVTLQALHERPECPVAVATDA